MLKKNILPAILFVSILFDSSTSFSLEETFIPTQYIRKKNQTDADAVACLDIFIWNGQITHCPTTTRQAASERPYSLNEKELLSLCDIVNKTQELLFFELINPLSFAQLTTLVTHIKRDDVILGVNIALENAMNPKDFVRPFFKKKFFLLGLNGIDNQCEDFLSVIFSYPCFSSLRVLKFDSLFFTTNNNLSFKEENISALLRMPQLMNVEHFLSLNQKFNIKAYQSTPFFWD